MCIEPRITKHICFFYRFERIKFLKKVIEETDKYPYKTDIFIHTNDFKFDLKILNCIYNNGSINFIYHDLSGKDPFLLSHKCRDLLKEQKDNYDIFMYSEDDILVTKENIEYWFKYYFDISEKQSNLGFLRVENYKNEDYVCDLICELYKVRSVGNFRCVINHLVPYCAFWIYDKKMFNYWISNADWYNPAKIPRYGVREKSAIGMCGIVPSIFRFTYIPITEQNQPVLGSKVIHLDPRFAMVEKYPSGQLCKFAKIPFNKIIKKEIEEE